MKLFLASLIFVVVASCANKDSKPVEDPLVTNKVRFKIWLNDTLSVISLNAVDTARNIDVTGDSLFLDIKNYYKLIMGSKYNGNNQDLLYAMDLLERNNHLPKKDFMLEFEIHHYYDPSPLSQFIYDFNSEVSKLIVGCNDSSFAYRFIKGNLIERKLILKAN